MTKRNRLLSTKKGPSLPFDFWSSPTLEELAEAQGVRPIADVSVLFGTWPGEVDDGFEEMVNTMRKTAIESSRAMSRVLAVVDDPYMRILVRRYLRGEGYEVGMAGGAEEALKLISEENFDAMVCDVASLGKAGMDLIAAVRSGDRLADIPAVALVSAERAESERAGAELAGYTRTEVRLEKDKFLLTMAELLKASTPARGK